MNKFLLTVSLIFATALLLSAATPLLEVSEGLSGKALFSGKCTTFQNDGVNCQVATQKIGGLNLWQLTFTTADTTPRKLTVTATLPYNFTATRYWDGAKEFAAAKEKLSRISLLDAFPMTAAWNDGTGAALAVAPQTPLSYLAREYAPGAIKMTARIVLDAIKPQLVSFVTMTFKPEFGFRNAVEVYHNAFPEFFAITPGVDERIYGVGGYHTGAHKQRLFQLHASRYSGLDWEWTYAPWLESGNWYPAGDSWPGGKQEFWHYHAIRKPGKLTMEEYDAAVRHEIAVGDKTAAMFYYVLVKDVHARVAEKFPDAVNNRGGMPSLPSNSGKTHFAFAPGSPLFDYLKKQIALVVENYDVSGFSFDMANSSLIFTRPSQLKYAVGRAFNDKGEIYTSDTIVPIPFADYIHTLKARGKTMGVVMNAALCEFSPFTFFHADGILIEGGPDMNFEMCYALRLTAGKKPLSFFGTYPRTDNTGIRWHQVTTDKQRKEIAHGLAQVALLKGYEWGVTPQNWATGFEGGTMFAPHLEILRELKRTGWQVVPAVKCNDKLWVGRFGKGPETLITISNPTRQAITTQVQVINSYLGQGKYGFIPRKGTLAQQFKNGRTEFTLTLAPKEICLLRAVELTGPAESLTAKVAATKVELNAPGATAFTCRFADFDGNYVASSSPSGKLMTGAFANGNATLTLLPKCSIDADAAKFLAKRAFPVLEAPAKGDANTAALMTAMYRPHVQASIKYCGRPTSREPGLFDSTLAKPELEIFAPGKAPANASLKICFGTPQAFPKLASKLTPAVLNSPDGFVKVLAPELLWIGGKNDAAVKRAAYHFFALLDNYKEPEIEVNFANPIGWGIGGKEVGVEFIPGDAKGKYLSVTGNPGGKNNQWRYGWCPVSHPTPGNKLTFTAQVKLEKLTAGRFDIGFYEFKKDGSHLAFTPVKVEPKAGWQEVTGTITVKPQTGKILLYFLGRNMGNGDQALVRALTLRNEAPAVETHHTEAVNFAIPKGWSIGGKVVGAQFIPGENKLKYLEISGDPDGKNNQWRYGCYPVKKFTPGKNISLKTSIKLENVTAGRFDVAIYEFQDKGAHLRMTPVKVEPKAGWQEVTASVTISPKAKSVMVYFLGRKLGKGDKALVRSLEIRTEK